mgnify:CR=1 FL=1|tara:strand:+ start:1636 stop:1869 length:234 start_codon:yes stop_codon:yes gene_type:complete
MTTLTIIEYTSYLLVLVGGMYTTYKAGEKSGSIYMLDYLRSNKYTDSNGVKVPFLNDTGFNRFMAHMRKEKENKDNV